MTGIPLFDEYNVYPGTWDEMCLDKNIRSQYNKVFEDISQLPADMLIFTYERDPVTPASRAELLT